MTDSRDVDSGAHSRAPFPEVVWNAFRYPWDVRTIIGLLCASLYLHVVFTARRIQGIRSFGIPGDLLLVVVFGATFFAYCIRVVQIACTGTDEKPSLIWVITDPEEALATSLLAFLATCLPFIPMIVCMILEKDAGLDWEGSRHAGIRATSFIVGMVYMPMAIVSAGYAGSLLSASPLRIVRAAVKTGPEYLFLAATALALAFAAMSLGDIHPAGGMLIRGTLSIAVVAAILYLAVALCRITGLTYWRNRSRIAWDFIREGKRDKSQEHEA